MTEKRFTDVEVDKYYGLICMNHDGQFHSYSEQSLEDLLNHLHEENIQLKQCLKKIEKELREYNELIWNNEVKEMYPLKEEGKQYRS